MSEFPRLAALYVQPPQTCLRPDGTKRASPIRPESIQIIVHFEVFKDADALDRWRIGDLDAAYLRTQSARQVLDASQALWTETRLLLRDDRAFDKILEAAVALGILVEC